ncbi:CaiB/BaiF CoA transferase family protein [Alkalihalobacterium chitinilyticum]|uniref:CoA transferase n=1 Tax=Alkalihalobacterium chitinilyticum TaxID=2980103 RepID=A0ABT5VJ46_9BACI|nr:CaiB/BaiF CoA-transferase family protein [Alkalihalobacterium chitinilyticum]MDE5415290.1 CoA transferase [Alkalihalobacterium chitinilyticum]
MLEGIRILDFSQYLPGPYASLRLGDMGAEVIKVEPLTGDPARALGDKREGTGLIFLANNRNKKSIALNLKEDEGKQIALDLMRQSDVVIESFRPGVMERLGLDYEVVKKENKDIIYCSLTGYGQDTALSHFGSHDINYIALSGMLSQLKDKRSEPVHPTITLADLAGGMAASEAILAALVQRSIKKEGSYIDLSLTDVMVSLMNNHVLIASEKGRQQGVAELTGAMISYHVYKTKDNRYMSLGALEPKFWINFCNAVGKDEWVPAHMSETTDQNPIYREMKELFQSYSMHEWMSFSQKVDCCMAPVLEPGELTSSKYVEERRLIFTPFEGYPEVATTYDKDSHTFPDLHPAPRLGEHTEMILKDVLKYPNEKVSRLRTTKVIKTEGVYHGVS